MRPCKRRVPRPALVLWLCLLPIACSENANTGDGGPTGDGSYIPNGKCAIDKSVDVETAIELTAEQAADGYICPENDNDYYKVVVPAGESLLKIELQHTAKVTPVDLTYLVLDAQGNTVATAPTAADNKFTSLHCVEAGTYYILVKDKVQAQDRNNIYQISYSTAADPDSSNEPNNGFDSATTLSGASGTGYIACNEDADYYAITVQANKLLEVTLSTTEGTPVDLRYTIYGSDQEPVPGADAVNVEGTKGPTDLKTIHALPGQGDYVIKVEDNENNEGDPTVPYTLSLQPRDEEDPRDQGGRNDTPATASSVGTGQTISNAQLGSKADIDFYKVDVPTSGVSRDNPWVIEVVVTYNGASPVDPSVGILYADRDNPCTSDTCCRVINPDGAACEAGSLLSCKDSSFNCITKDDIFCSTEACVPQGTTPTCSTDLRCAGSAQCTSPSGGQKYCLVEQTSRSDPDGSDTAIVRTAQPLYHPGPYWVRVNDLGNDEYAHGVAYTVSIRARADPDSRELDTEYVPKHLTLGAELEDWEDNSRDIAMSRGESNFGGVGSTLTFSGHISYEGDEDWYAIGHPCPSVTPTGCQLYVTYNDTCSGNDKPRLAYFITRRGGSVELSWPSNPTPGLDGTFGEPNECVVAQPGGDLFLKVIDHGQETNPQWGWDCGYTVTIEYRRDDCIAPCGHAQSNGVCCIGSKCN